MKTYIVILIIKIRVRSTDKNKSSKFPGDVRELRNTNKNIERCPVWLSG